MKYKVIKSKEYLQKRINDCIFVKNNYNLYLTTRFLKFKPDCLMLKKIQEQLQGVNNTLHAFSLKLTGNMMDAEDLYQDTNLRIIANADKYQPNTNFKAWAVTIMRNVFINNYRKKVRRGVILDQTSNNYYLNSGNSMVRNDGEGNVAFGELMKMVNRLDDDFKVPFWMAYQGYKYDEIASKLEVPLGTVKSRIFFARKKLQKMYRRANLERA